MAAFIVASVVFLASGCGGEGGSNGGGTGGGNNSPNTPSNPSPSNGATDVPVTTNLSWTGGDPDPGDTVTYDVYFGTTNPPPLVTSNHPSTIWDPPGGDLDEGKTYYWKIKAKDNNGATTTAPIWSFTTVGTPPPDCEISVSPVRLDFGDVTVGSSRDQSVTVTNVGTVDCDCITSLTSGQSHYSLPSGGGSFTLRPGQQRTVAVRFSPGVRGPLSGNLRIACDGTTKDVPLTGTGVDDIINMTVTCPPNFGSVELGQNTTRTATIKNESSSTGTLIVTNLYISSGTSDYQIIGGGGSFSLPPGQSRTVMIRFTPQAAGTRPGNLRIIHNATNTPSPKDCPLTGTGTVEVINMTVTCPPNFGSVELGQDTTRTATIKNENSSTGALVGSVSISSGTSDYQIIGGGGSFSLPPGQSRTVTIRFTPQAVGTRNGNLRISPHNATNTGDPKNCTLTGIGTQNRAPNTPSRPSGPIRLEVVRETGTFTASTTDPDGDRVQYRFDWGDGRISGWTPLVSSGTSGSEATSWRESSAPERDYRYHVKAQARDERGARSGWSQPYLLKVWETWSGTKKAGDYAFMVDVLPNRNTCRPSQTQAGVFSGAVYRALLRWDLSSLAGYDTGDVHVENATLRLDLGHQTTVGSGTFQLRRVLDSWSCGSVTWNNKPPMGSIYESFTIPGGSFTYSVDWLGPFISWINGNTNGLYVKRSVEPSSGISLLYITTNGSSEHAHISWRYRFPY